jgi:hypothetical protein
MESQFIPALISKNILVRDIIVHILAEGLPMSLMQIYNKIRKNQGNKSMTYQAVHKAMKSLIDDNVVEKTGKTYEISSTWIDKISIFAENLKETKRKKNVFPFNDVTGPVLEQGKSITLQFNDMNSLGKWWERFEDSGYLKTKVVYRIANHVLLPIFRLYRSGGPYKTRRYTKRMYIGIGGDKPIDRWAAKVYKMLGAKVKTGVQLSKNYYYVTTFDDYILESHAPTKLVKTFWTLIEKAKKLDDFDFTAYFEYRRKKAIIKMTIIRDKDIAKQFQHKIMAYF